MLRSLPLIAVGLLVPLPAAAFCGFYVAQADSQLFNNASQVALMRQGTRTVLSMQNNYKGPPEDFAMVVPVPVVLQKSDVKTLPKPIFERLDQLAAPRLVEYWEQDPCRTRVIERSAMGLGVSQRTVSNRERRSAAHGVKIEAQFTVDEYKVVILSAKHSAGLDTWLRAEKYKIPPGAEPLLRPYVQSGMRFFVAKVDAKKVQFDADGRATLSPLRFHYDSKEFALPVRLGMLNSEGTQDLIVHILAQARYEVANYDNVTIPTNIDVENATRERFGEFYAALFDATVHDHPGAVVTEYAWSSASCDPCPVPPLTPSDLATLGADVLPDGRPQPGGPAMRGRRIAPPRGMVLTRLHARYQKDGIKQDLRFVEAPSIVGGRELRDGDGMLERGAVEYPRGNAFQARYAIRHAWTGPIECPAPVRGRWGGPPRGQQPYKPTVARDLANAPRGRVALATFVKGAVPELSQAALSGKAAEAPPTQPAPQAPAQAQPPKPETVQPTPDTQGAAQLPAARPPPETETETETESTGCRAAAGDGDAASWLFWVTPALLALRRRRR